MAGRLLAGSTIAALLSPWLVVLATAVHVTLDHGHGDHGLAGRVAAAWHGHDHLSDTVPHDHDTAPAEGRAWAPAPRVAAATIPVVTLPDEAQPRCWAGTGRGSAPQPPTASPPILRV